MVKDREAWYAEVNGVTKRHDGATEEQQQHISQVNGTNFTFKVYLLKPQNFEVLSY